MSNNLVYQYFVNNNNPTPHFAKLSWAAFSRYADQWGAEWIAQTHNYFEGNEQVPYSALFEVLRIIYDPMFDQYDKVLFVDSDILPSPTAPNIFETPVQHWAGWTEQQVCEGAGHAAPYLYPNQSADCKQSYDQLKDICELHQVPWVPDHLVENARGALRVLNTGVFLTTKQGRHLAREKFDNWIDWANCDSMVVDGERRFRRWLLNDQVFISAMLCKHDIHCEELSYKWNCTPEFFPRDTNCPHTLYRYIPDEVYFYHLSGNGKQDMAWLYNNLYGTMIC